MKQIYVGIVRPVATGLCRGGVSGEGACHGHCRGRFSVRGGKNARRDPIDRWCHGVAPASFADLLGQPVIWIGETVAWLVVLVVLIIADAISRATRSLSIVAKTLHFFSNCRHSGRRSNGYFFCALGYAGALNAYSLGHSAPRFSVNGGCGLS